MVEDAAVVFVAGVVVVTVGASGGKLGYSHDEDVISMVLGDRFKDDDDP